MKFDQDLCATCDMNSTLGSVVPLAMFQHKLPNVETCYFCTIFGNSFWSVLFFRFFPRMRRTTYHKDFGLTYGGEGGEAKVESVKELPVFTIGEHCGTRGPDDHREEENHQD